MKVLKSSLLIVAALFIGFNANAQVGIGTTDPHASSILELSSTTSGLLIPRVTTTQMNNINSPATGLVVYNTTESCIYFFTGSVWQSSCSNASNYWGTTGNSSLTGSNFIGSTDATNLNFRTNNVQRMVLNSSGNLGIGVASPSNALTVSGSLPLRLLGTTHDASVDTVLVINPSGVVYKRAVSSINSGDWKTTGNSGTNASTNYIGTSDNVDLAFRVNNQEVGRYKTTTRSFQGGDGSVVTGTNTFVFSQNDTVGASYSAAFGSDNDFETNANYSVVFGGQNTVKGTASYSVTSGELNINEGVHGSAHGEHLIVNSYNMFAVGSYNDTITGNRTWVDSTNHLFVVGNGHKFCDRSNVITATWGGNVGLANSNPQTTLDVHGGFSLRPRTTLTEGTTTTVTSNNFPYTVENRSYLQITSDGSPASRSIVLSDGLQTGQIIVIESVTPGGINGIRIVDNAGTHNINSNGTRDLYTNDVIVLMWNGTDWIEISYTNN
jgi:hypothetical protein